MTKYDELNIAYTKYDDSFIKFRDNCNDFYVTLRSQIINQFEIPSEHLKFLPVNRDDVKKDYVFHPMLAMELMEDAFWHVKMVFVFERGKNISPKEHMWIEILVNELNNDFNVKLTYINKSFTYKNVADIKTLNLDDLINCIYDELIKYYENRLINFIRSSEKKGIGYIR